MSENPTTKKRPLSQMRLAELREVAIEMGLQDTEKMRKAELLAAIRGAQGAKPQADSKPQAEPQPQTKSAQNRGEEKREESTSASKSEPASKTDSSEPRRRRRRAESNGGTPAAIQLDVKAELGEPQDSHNGASATSLLDEIKLPSADDAHQDDGSDSEDGSNRKRNKRNNRDNNRDNNRNNNREHHRDDKDRDDRGRRRRGRDRTKRRRDDEEPQLQEDDVLIPVAGILDVQNNHAFVRTSGYLPGPNDVYVTLGNVRRWNLRPGDAIVGSIRQPRQNERQRQKYNALVAVDSINGISVEQAGERPEFSKLTPLYPDEHLRLETTPKAITPRIIDLVAPIGKGQRGLIVSPPKAGKTIIMQQMANAISQNNPDVHLMVVLVDERPEEVTDMRRTVKGEVIASTFDRPASDHTIVAELAIERAKRLVELGHDVVVLLDSITRLGRAYNLAAPASGRILSGGVDASALYPPKKFFGAARNVEEGGSLTIIASALVETGSKMDEVIFEEFKGTGNMELRLSRQLSERRIYPAVDVNASGTRREEMLFKKEELAIMWRLRRVLGQLDQQQALELMLDKLKDTQNNAEFLMAIAKTTPKD
ncbi:transcription termination factor Rho [Gleimia europaea ACS-120-V-Col10b]|uniref:Transcription termination factor Rho n=2 Tax=Gleimia TaxID=2692113 RepID=A0A9W5RE78_9ACTO|nr:transcription termination factor Rho [Gleimia europaea]EPD30760.1 transcription termination factor Rho [Gleimia europaea ACS-120-V-Col10b]